MLGLVRARAPLPLLLYIAARDGLVVEQPGGGFAVLQPPPIYRSGRRGQRLIRWVDRHWDMSVLALPPVLSMAVAAATIPFPAANLADALVVLLGAVWIATMMTAMLVHQFGWLSRMGRQSSPRHSRTAESPPGYYWSAPLFHQPHPDRVDALLRLMSDRLSTRTLALAHDPAAAFARLASLPVQTG